jgi:nucleoside-diphosphate-sugar epimerase
MKRILVTGAAGFIGSRVVGRLVRDGIETGAVVRPGSAAERLQEVRGDSLLTVLEADIASPGAAAALLDEFRPDGVIHLAAAGVHGRAPLAEMLRTNVTGLARFLEHPEKIGSRLVAAGSVFEYGPCDDDITEETPCRPHCDYGLSKLLATELLLHRDDVDWVVLRPFGVYGPWESAGRLVPSLVSGLGAGRGVPLTDGGQVRDFVFVEDAADAFVKALHAPEARRKVINVGSGRATSVRELALLAAAGGPATEDREKLLHFGARPRREAEPERLVASTARARELLGWEATTSLDEGLARCFEWSRSEPGGVWNRVPGLDAAFSIVMPCYNEEASLPDSVPPLAEILERQGLSCEIVLVDNGSADGTAAVIDGFIEKGLPVTRVDVMHNEGYGAGIIAGLNAAQGRYLGFMCADGQVAPEDVARVLWTMERAGPGALVKVRRVSRGDGLFRWIQSRVFNLLCLLLFRTLTTDINATPKMMERRAWERMELQCRDWFIDAEVVFKAKKLGLNFVEVPVIFMPRQAGRSWVNLGTTFEFVRNLLRALVTRR